MLPTTCSMVHNGGMLWYREYALLLHHPWGGHVWSTSLLVYLSMFTGTIIMMLLPSSSVLVEKDYQYLTTGLHVL